MATAPAPAEIFDRAVEEGNRRLEQSVLELVSTSFIAGFTIVFGIVALGIVEANVEPELGRLARIAGALAFGIGFVFLVVGRSELFNDNFFDPTAAAADRSDEWPIGPLARLWTLTLAFNLAGGCLLVLVFSVEVALPPDSTDALNGYALEVVDRGIASWFTRAIAGGALVSLMSFMLAAAEDTGSRMAIAYLVGFLIGLGPFDHVVVAVLHVAFGVLNGAAVGPGTLLSMAAVVTAGNLVGGLGLVTFAHVEQAKGARESES